MKFINAVRSNKIAEADAVLYELHAEGKSRACLFGVLVLGKRAPEKWHRYAEKLLFINERPYFMEAIL